MQSDLCCRVEQAAGEGGAPDAPARARPERAGGDRAVGRVVAHAGKGEAHLDADAELAQMVYTGRHQPFAAGLVHGKDLLFA